MSTIEQISGRIEAITIALAIAEENKVRLSEHVFDGVNAIGTLIVSSIINHTKWSEAEMLTRLVAKRREMQDKYDADTMLVAVLKAAFGEPGSVPAPDLKDAVMGGSLKDIAAALAKRPVPPKGTV